MVKSAQAHGEASKETFRQIGGKAQQTPDKMRTMDKNNQGPLCQLRDDILILLIFIALFANVRVWHLTSGTMDNL